MNALFELIGSRRKLVKDIVCHEQLRADCSRGLHHCSQSDFCKTFNLPYACPNIITLCPEELLIPISFTLKY